MTELKRCPFCGCKKAEVVKHKLFDGLETTYWVECQNCRTSTYHLYPTEEQAIKAWNHRANVIEL